MQVAWTLWFGYLLNGMAAQRMELRPEQEQLARLAARESGPVLADANMDLLVRDERALLLQPFELSRLAQEERWTQRS